MAEPGFILYPSKYCNHSAMEADKLS